MSGDYVVFGMPRTGAVLAEAALTLLELPYRRVDVADYADEPLAAANPMRQVPAMLLPSGELMTESAAILTWLADEHPQSRLAPSLASGARPAFLRWMSFVSAAIYGLYWVRDQPSRITDDPALEPVVREHTAERIAACWAAMDAQVTPDRYILGEDLSVLDLYVAVLSRWGPRRRRFYELAPNMTPAVLRVDADPRLEALWAERFQFVEGWEG